MKSNFMKYVGPKVLLGILVVIIGVGVLGWEGFTKTFFGSGTSDMRGDKITTGDWVGSQFENEWSNIKFTLPEGFEKLDRERIDQEVDLSEGTTCDFCLEADKNLANVTVIYFHEDKGTSAEQCRNVEKKVCKEENICKDFKDRTIKIAGEEYIGFTANNADGEMIQKYLRVNTSSGNVMHIEIHAANKDSEDQIIKFLTSIEKVKKD